MKTKELIEQLKKMDPEQEVHIAIGTYTQVYPSAYVTPHDVGIGSTRIYVNLPEGMSISKRKGPA